jgi:hypothetical protein
MLSSYETACVKRTALSVLKNGEFLLRSQREVLQIRVIILQCVTVRPFVLFNSQVVKRIFMKFCSGQYYKVLFLHCILWWAVLQSFVSTLHFVVGSITKFCFYIAFYGGQYYKVLFLHCILWWAVLQSFVSTLHFVVGSITKFCFYIAFCGGQYYKVLFPLKLINLDVFLTVHFHKLMNKIPTNAHTFYFTLTRLHVSAHEGHHHTKILMVIILYYIIFIVCRCKVRACIIGLKCMRVKIKMLK